MKRPSRLLAFFFFLVAITLGQSKILDSDVEIDDRRLVPLTESFGYADGGRLVITLHNISIYSKNSPGADATPSYSLDNFGLFLSPVEADANLELDLAEDKCVLRSVRDLFTFKNSSVQKVMRFEAPSITFNLTVSKGGAYYLYFANCETDTPISFGCHIGEHQQGSNHTIFTIPFDVSYPPQLFSQFFTRGGNRQHSGFQDGASLRRHPRIFGALLQ
eukprot:gene15864-21991_t